jgi:hypothetical protein
MDRSDPDRRRAEMPDLGLAIDHRRVEDMDDLTLPDWLAHAIQDSAQA